MRINHNIAALNTYRQYNNANDAQAKTMEKLSSGMRINNAADDAAGLAISEKMRGQIRGLDKAASNAQDANSLIQTAEGALNETTDILQRMRELAVQAGNDTNTETDRNEIQKEVNSLTSEVNRIGNTTEFNTQKLLNGDKDGSEAVTKEAGEFTFKLSGTLDDVTIDGKTLKYDAAGDGTSSFKDAASLATLIGNTDDLKDKYSAANNAGTLTLTQKSGKESATDAKVGGATTDFTVATKGAEGKEAGKGNSLKFQIGANENQSLTLNISDMTASALGIATKGNADSKLAVTDGTNNTTIEQALDLSTHDKAGEAVTKIQSAIEKVSGERSKLGANQNRLDHTIKNLSTSSENLSSAESRIRDTDMAKTMMEQTKNSILAQASQAMLSQANQQPQQVLQLLR